MPRVKLKYKTKIAMDHDDHEGGDTSFTDLYSICDFSSSRFLAFVSHELVVAVCVCVSCCQIFFPSLLASCVDLAVKSF